MATILLVDANPADRRAYITLLGNYGHQLLEAGDADQALTLARVELPDLVIIDILLPSMDGFTLARRLRAELLLIAVPVIFHTANYDESEIHRRARAEGIQHILRKPAEPQEILRAVNESLKQPDVFARKSHTGELPREHLEVLTDKLYQKIAELEQANEDLRTHSLSDGLTGLNNRRGFMILATSLLRFSRRAGYSSALIYIDLDSLKYINDTFGHTGGDEAITRFARILTDTFRDSDVIGRLGGDEFVILMIDATEADLADMQEHLQNNVKAHNLQIEEGLSLAFSMGNIRVESTSTVSMEELLSRADEAMYRHKQSRRRAS
jgi:diguanylate cyclase (GGDEF)-like protein